MAQPPLHNPNDPAGRHATAGRMTEPEEKKSKIIPIAIGIVALLVFLFFIVPMFTGDDEAETTEATTEATAPETTPAVTEEEPTTEPVVPDTDMAEPEAETTESPVSVEEPAAPTSPAVTPETGTDIDDGDTQQGVTVEIEDPAETPAPTPAPVEAETETTTVPLQEPAPAN